MVKLYLDQYKYIPSINIKIDCIPNQLNRTTIITIKPLITVLLYRTVPGVHHAPSKLKCRVRVRSLFSIPKVSGKQHNFLRLETFYML